MARTLVEQADKANAQRYAPADLQRAHDELSSAEKAVNDRKYDDARRYAENAQVDADLASARASSGEAQRAAQEVNRSIDSLKQESERHTNDPGTN
jgi:putative cell wall-binding protein